AQLGERYLDRVEVAGSNPVGIINEISFKTLMYQCFETKETGSAWAHSGPFFMSVSCHVPKVCLFLK
ncbi:hypothetical protein, partial [Indiicoccus explosivorum]|uniref:hypothetical protein n=1 Tax=Indiicoccus explosivorum TaxID=1917864 RepID=UPI0019D3BC77